MPGHPGSCQQQFSPSGIQKIGPACQVNQSTTGQVLSQSIRIQMPVIMVSQHELDWPLEPIIKLPEFFKQAVRLAYIPTNPDAIRLIIQE